MTEGRYDELFAAIRAHRDDLVRLAEVVAEASAKLRERARFMRSRGHPRWALETTEVAEELETVAVGIATGIESLHRRADATLDETQPMGLAELLDDQSKPTTG